MGMNTVQVRRRKSSSTLCGQLRWRKQATPTEATKAPTLRW